MLCVHVLEVHGNEPRHCTGKLAATRFPPPLAKEHNYSSRLMQLTKHVIRQHITYVIPSYFQQHG